MTQGESQATEPGSMAPGLTTVKRSHDGVEDSSSPASKKPRGEPPAEPQPKSQSPSPARSSLAQSEHTTEDTKEDKALAETVRFLENSFEKFKDGVDHNFVKRRQGPLTGRYDYRLWKEDMKEILEMHGLWDLVDNKLVGHPLSPRLQTQLRLIERLTLRLIGINVPQATRTMVYDAKTSHEAWEDLRKLYQLSPTEMSMEGWSLMKEKKISQYPSAMDYIFYVKDAWRQVCMDRADLFEQTQPMLCTALLHGLDGLQWAMWKNNIVTDGDIGSDFDALAAKVLQIDPTIRQAYNGNPRLK